MLRNPFITTLKTLITLLILAGCVSIQPTEQSALNIDVTYAFMTIKSDNYSSAAKIWQYKQKLRMEVLGGRKSNTMLVDYSMNQAAVLVPSTGEYQTFQMEQLNQAVPHFFDPEVTQEKIDLGEDTIDGQLANKYQLTATGRTGHKHLGTLWTSQQVPEFPLKWIDAEQGIIVTWENLEQQSHSTDWFNIPAHYLNLAR